MLRSPFHVKRRTQSQYLSEADGRVDICYHRAEESAWYFQHQKHLFSAFIFCPLRVTSFGRHTRHFHLEVSTSLSSRREKKLLCKVVKQVQNLKKSHVVFFCFVQDYSPYPKWHVLTTLCFVGVIHRDHQMFCFSSNLGSATWLVNTVCFLCPVLSQSTFLVNGHLYFIVVKVHWMSAVVLIHPVAVIADQRLWITANISWGLLNIKPANLTCCAT